MAKKQALLGMMFAGAERLPASSYPPEALMMQWLRNVMVIRRKNAVLDSKCREVTSTFASIGYDSCILKGQGVARLYPDPGLRQSGDIDIWVRESGSYAHDISISEVRELINKVKTLGIGTLDMAVYHHVGWSIPGCEVEIHYRLSFFNTPWIDRRQSHTTAGKFLMRTRHRMRFVKRYPMEVICDIPFRFYNYAWRVTLKLGDACG